VKILSKSLKILKNLLISNKWVLVGFAADFGKNKTNTLVL
jgi:hypothetical protein